MRGAERRWLVSPGIIGAFRLLVWRRLATVTELHRCCEAGGVEVSLRTLEHYVYELEHPSIQVPIPPTGVAWWHHGELSPNAKLTESQARWVLAQEGKRTSREVSELLGGAVGDSAVRMIWSGRRWSWLQEEHVEEVAYHD
jgi:hypothetical protein